MTASSCIRYSITNLCFANAMCLALLITAEACAGRFSTKNHTFSFYNILLKTGNLCKPDTRTFPSKNTARSQTPQAGTAPIYGALRSHIKAVALRR